MLNQPRGSSPDLLEEIWGPKKSFNSKESSEAFPEFSEQFGPSIHEMKGFSRAKLYTPPPPSPHFWPEGTFQWRGVGVNILRPHAAGILYAPPPFIHPPPLEGSFQGWGGWGCIKFGPVVLVGIQPKKFTRTSQNLGRQILGNTFF